MSIKAILMEDWLRGCVFHDGRHGSVTLPCDKVLEIADYIQTSRTSGTDGCIDIHAPTENTNAPTNAPTELISRQDAIEGVKELFACADIGNDECDITYMLENLPSADRPTGEWIKSNILPNGWHCSHCDSPVMTDDIEEMLFCPNCGVRMYKGGEDE